MQQSCSVRKRACDADCGYHVYALVASWQFPPGWLLQCQVALNIYMGPMYTTTTYVCTLLSSRCNRHACQHSTVLQIMQQCLLNYFLRSLIYPLNPCISSKLEKRDFQTCVGHMGESAPQKKLLTGEGAEVRDLGAFLAVSDPNKPAENP